MAEQASKPDLKPVRGDAVAIGLENLNPDRWFKVRRVLELFSFIAVILGLPLVVWETRIAAIAHQEEVAISKMALTDSWIQKMQSNEILSGIAATQDYLTRNIRNQVKIGRVNKDKAFRMSLTKSLGFFEELGLLYNLDALHKPRVARGCGRAITNYWDASSFWIRDYRDKAGNPGLFKEFEVMVEDLKKSMPKVLLEKPGDVGRLP